jgi:hypothetical protein
MPTAWQPKLRSRAPTKWKRWRFFRAQWNRSGRAVGSTPAQFGYSSTWQRRPRPLTNEVFHLEGPSLAGADNLPAEAGNPIQCANRPSFHGMVQAHDLPFGQP